MRKRFLLAATTLAAVVPTLAMAQARPAQPAARPASPPAQQPRPANPPAQQPRPAAAPARPMASAMAGTAQRKGALELGIQGSILGMMGDLGTVSADMANLTDRANVKHFGPGGTVRLGYQIAPALTLGADLGYGMLGGGVSTLQPAANLAYTFNADNSMSPFIEAQAGMNMVKGGRSNETGMGGGVGLGLRRFLNENLALRVEALVAMQSFSYKSSSGMAPQFNIGVSHWGGGGPPKDTDGDGVPDKHDACANTIHGATVDARGCPQDSDHDGVYNGLDRCPDTPANTPVDANGCTRDTDHDGIADNLDRCPNTPAGTPVDANGCPRDSDGDGVADNLDRCPNTARGTPVDANGCPRDSDGDGVVDSADRCPNTPAGTPVDANGCPRDADGDGVSDNLDRCPNTAPGTQVDANGCPVQRDADGDGVIDANDRCPNTAHGARVDATGCPLYELPAMGAKKVVAVTTTGVGARMALTPAARTELDKVATAILATPNSRWEIGGYTSNRGVAATLRRASQARAQLVMTYLVSKGVPAASLTAVGYGSANPVQPNTTLAGRNANNRVEIKRVQ